MFVASVKMIILYNPQVDDFLAAPPHFGLLNRRPLKKYGFFLEETFKRGNNINVLVDGTISAFVPERIFHKLPKVIRNIIASLEYRMWLKCNRFPLASVLRVSPADAACEDVLLAFSYKAATGKFELRRTLLSRYTAVVFHLSHYFIATDEKARNLRSLDNVILGGDSDLTSNSYFESFFSWYQRPFLVLPFAVARRFLINKKYVERKMSCVATGSFHDLEREHPRHKYLDYISRTGFSTYHPVRKLIYEKRDELARFVKCNVVPYRDYSGSSWIIRFVKHLAVSQRNYFSLNIVDLYNDYCFAVVGEEVAGFPALGAFEAIACGTVLIAQPDYYKGLGLDSDVHFIPYNGSLSQLRDIIESAEIEKIQYISAAGQRYVSQKFSPTAVYTHWMSEICALGNEGVCQYRFAHPI